MGESLSDLFYRCGRKFSLKTVLMLGEQLVTRLEAVHNAGIVHRDVKPGNFVMGRGEEAGTVFVIDFGLSNYWRSNSGHIPFNTESPFRGTHRYASVNSHRKFEQSRRDDLEAIGYVLIYFLNGGLPWQSLRVARNKRRKAIGVSKASFSPEALCEGLPRQFAEFLKYVKVLNFEQKPNYSYCRNLFKTCFTEAGLEDDGVWDWELPHVTASALHPMAHTNGVTANNMLLSQMGINSGVPIYSHPALSMSSPYHTHTSSNSLNAPHLPHTHGTEMARSMMHAPTSIRAPTPSVPISRAHAASNGLSAASMRHASPPSAHQHLARSPSAHSTVPRPCVNLTASMPLSNSGRMMSYSRTSSAPYTSAESTNGFSPLATSHSVNTGNNAPTYASMLRSSSGSPMPADSIAYLDYCNSQAQHSSQSLSNSSYLQPTTASTSTTSLASNQPTHAARNGSKNRLEFSRFSAGTEYSLPTPQRASNSRTILNKNGPQLLVNGMQSDNSLMNAWNVSSSANSPTAHHHHHSTSSPMLGGAYESMNMASAAPNAASYGNGSNFVSTHLLQLNSPSMHYGSVGNGHMSVTVPSSPTNSLLLNGPSSPLIHEPSPLMHLSSMLDEDTLFSNSLPAFSTASSSSQSSSALFSRAMLTSSSSTVTAPVVLGEPSTLSNGPTMTSSPVPTPDSPSSSTRPDSPLQLDSNLWVDASASTLADAGLLSHVGMNSGAVMVDLVEDESAPFASSHMHHPHHHLHHLHHHHHRQIISIDDALSSEVTATPSVTSALVCVEQPVANLKKRSRNVHTDNAMCSALPEPITKRRSTRLLEKDYYAAPRSGALQY